MVARTFYVGKIAVIGTTADSIINFRGDLIRALVALGWNVYAFAIDYSEKDKNLVKGMGAKPIDYSLSRVGLNPFRDIVDTLRMVKLFRDIRPDLVFSYFAKPVVFASVAARIAKVPRRIAMLEGLGSSFTERPRSTKIRLKFIRRVQVALYRISFPLLDRVIFLNSDDAEELIVRNKIKVKSYSVLGGIGLDLACYPYSQPLMTPVTFIFIGRLLIEKGVKEYMAACRGLKEDFPDVQCVLLGGLDVNSPRSIYSEIEELNSAGVIVYPGHVEDVSVWLANSSVFVLPSYREGFPRSTQEAMAVGRPVITTAVPGCKDTVLDGVNGFLVPPWSSDELLEKMRYFVENPLMIQKMGEESFKIAHRSFDSRKVNEKLINLLLEE